MKKLLLIMLLWFLPISCTEKTCDLPDGKPGQILVHEEGDKCPKWVYPDGLPEGYKMMCSPEGKYTIKIPDYPLPTCPVVWDDEEEARRFSWYWEATKDKPYIPESYGYDWQPCDQEPPTLETPTLNMERESQ